MPIEIELEWTERAIIDYENLIEYLFFAWDEKTALRVLTKIDYQIERVRTNPLHFPIIDPSTEIRRCVASPQTSVFFSIKPESIKLLSIFDNRLDPQKYPK